MSFHFLNVFNNNIIRNTIKYISFYIRHHATAQKFIINSILDKLHCRKSSFNGYSGSRSKTSSLSGMQKEILNASLSALTFLKDHKVHIDWKIFHGYHEHQ